MVPFGNTQFTGQKPLKIKYIITRAFNWVGLSWREITLFPLHEIRYIKNFIIQVHMRNTIDI